MIGRYNKYTQNWRKFSIIWKGTTAGTNKNNAYNQPTVSHVGDIHELLSDSVTPKDKTTSTEDQIDPPESLYAYPNFSDRNAAPLSPLPSSAPGDAGLHMVKCSHIGMSDTLASNEEVHKFSSPPCIFSLPHATCGKALSVP